MALTPLVRYGICSNCARKGVLLHSTTPPPDINTAPRMATYVSTPIPHSPFVQPQYVHTATPTVVHTPLPTAQPVLATPAIATTTLATPALQPAAMPSYYVPTNGYQRARSHSMSYAQPQPQVYYPSYGHSQYPQAGPGQYYTTVHTTSTPYHDGYSRSRRPSTSHYGSPSHHRSHSTHGSSSHRRSHSTTRSHSRHHSQPQVIDLRHHSGGNYVRVQGIVDSAPPRLMRPRTQTTHIVQPTHHRRYSATSPGIGDRLRNLFGMQPSHRYYDARTGHEVDYRGRPIYHM